MAIFDATKTHGKVTSIIDTITHRAIPPKRTLLKAPESNAKLTDNKVDVISIVDAPTFETFEVHHI